MNWTLIIVVSILPLVVLVAWTLWLHFAYRIAKQLGVDGLKAIKHVATAFRPHEWTLLAPRQVLKGAASTIGMHQETSIPRSGAGEPTLTIAGEDEPSRKV